MVRIQRHVRNLAANSVMESELRLLESYSNTHAWVLLGEPGSGKTTALQMEAERSDGAYLSLAEFVATDEIQPQWHNRPIFLDGLDEMRVGLKEDTTLLYKVDAKLRRLGKPRFRIACRTAEWLGDTDAGDIAKAAGTQPIISLALQALSPKETQEILVASSLVDDGDAFIRHAQEHGLDELLGNPQAAILLAKAIQGHGWPKTRLQTYELACKNLATETSLKHQRLKRFRAVSTNDVLDAAGHICALLLLSGKTGVALSAAYANGEFANVQELSLASSDRQALGCALFLPAGVEQVVPCHRSVGEFLAARTLAHAIQKQRVPAKRITQLLVGRDGRPVSGLRALYAWLALLSSSSQRQLIDADPISIAIYSDLAPFSLVAKQHLLQRLRDEAERWPGSLWPVLRSDNLRKLAEPELAKNCLEQIRHAQRSEASQIFLLCILKIAQDLPPSVELGDALIQTVRDATFRENVRREAIDAWLKCIDDPQQARALLNDISTDKVSDPCDSLAGRLLLYLYPQYLPVDMLFDHLHAAKDQNILGLYDWFWSHELGKRAPDESVPMLLNLLSRHEEVPRHSARRPDLHELRDTLLSRGIQKYGDHVDDQQLAVWLGMGVDQYGNGVLDETCRKEVSEWLSARPERYKGVLAQSLADCISKRTHFAEARLFDATKPADLGTWHLTQAAQIEDETLAKEHLSRVGEFFDHEDTGGLIIEDVEAWLDRHPQKRAWFRPIAWSIRDWIPARKAKEREDQAEQASRKHKRSIELRPYYSAIEAGSARFNLMHDLSHIWQGNYFSDIRGKDSAARFNEYVVDGNELMLLAEAGLRQCPKRDDIPSVQEIVALATKKRQYLVREPCMVGMELRWQDGPKEVEALADQALGSMIAFWLTYPVGQKPAWVDHVAQSRSKLFAEVLVVAGTAAMKSKQEHVAGVYELERDSSYQAIAEDAAPRLLRSFPIRATAVQLHSLRYLLKASWLWARPALAKLIERKTSLKGMDAGQRVHWLVMGMVLNPARYEKLLWRYVGHSETRINHLAALLADADGTPCDFDLTVHNMGLLIERLAPHSTIDRPSGVHWVSDSMVRGDFVRSLINRLSSQATQQADDELGRLIGLSSLKTVKRLLEAAWFELKTRQREQQFRFPTVQEIAQVLANGAPTNYADLAALILDHLDDIARKIQTDNDDGFRSFWNGETKEKAQPRNENSCRDLLLARLRQHLNPLEINCEPEVDHAGDKRADLRVLYRNELAVPIEIKRDTHTALWTAIRDQLQLKYATAPQANSFGIYLVFWFGQKVTGPNDGGKHPKNPQELQSRLEKQLTPLERQKIFVRVVDVSWRTNATHNSLTF